MNPLEIFQKHIVVGLDFGSSSIKLAALERKDGNFRLIKLDAREVALSQNPTEEDAARVSALKELLKGIPAGRSQLIVSVNCPKTAVKVVTVPPMPVKEMKEAVKLESRTYFSFPIDGAYVDFESAGEIAEKGTRKLRVRVATSSKSTVDQALLVMKKAGLCPHSIIPATYALQKLAEVTAKDSKEIRCWIEMGDQSSEFMIFRGNEAVFSRKMPVGGRDFTQALTSALTSDQGRVQLTWQEAEEVKCAIGIPAPNENRVIDNKISTTQIRSLFLATLEHFSQEADRCFDYFREETGGAKIDSVILFGAGASLKGLIGYLSQELGMEVKRGNPLEGLPVEAARHSHGESRKSDESPISFAIAIGAALMSGQTINLLPAEIRERTRRSLKRALVEAAAAAFILVSVFVYIGLRIEAGNFQKKVFAARTELANLNLIVNESRPDILARNLLANEPYWEEIFKEVSRLLPAEIQLREISKHDRKIILKGIVFSKDRDTLLSDFIVNMEKSFFKNLKLITTREMKDQDTSEFELECPYE